LLPSLNNTCPFGRTSSRVQYVESLAAFGTFGTGLSLFEPALYRKNAMAAL
jgi:hypothetical protein